MIACTHEKDGAVCGADLATYRGAFARNGVPHGKYTCTAGHKRVCWLSPEGVRIQVHFGRGFGTDNKTEDFHARWKVRDIERVTGKGYTPQQFLDYCLSLDLPAR